MGSKEVNIQGVSSLYTMSRHDAPRSQAWSAHQQQRMTSVDNMTSATKAAATWEDGSISNNVIVMKSYLNMAYWKVNFRCQGNKMSRQYRQASWWQLPVGNTGRYKIEAIIVANGNAIYGKVLRVQVGIRRPCEVQ